MPRYIFGAAAREQYGAIFISLLRFQESYFDMPKILPAFSFTRASAIWRHWAAPPSPRPTPHDSNTATLHIAILMSVSFRRHSNADNTLFIFLMSRRSQSSIIISYFIEITLSRYIRFIIYRRLTITLYADMALLAIFLYRHASLVYIISFRHFITYAAIAFSSFTTYIYFLFDFRLLYLKPLFRWFLSFRLYRYLLIAITRLIFAAIYRLFQFTLWWRAFRAKRHRRAADTAPAELAISYRFSS